MEVIVLASGTVFNIQRYSTHDGPGIRTTLFFKGCPLSCWWCHNPESKHREAVVLLNSEKCLACGACAMACPHGAISLCEGTPVLDYAKCIACGQCHKRCPSEALQLVGRSISVAEAMAEIEKDRVFYDESGGGVTCSGGEPLLQDEFLYELLQKCGERGIHRAVDTSGFAPWPVLAHISEVTDLFLYDIKHMDSDRHRSITGVPNDLILDNVRRLASMDKEIHLRVPIIPRLNDDEANLQRTGLLAMELKIARVHILPYHYLGKGKYQGLGESYEIPDIQPPSTERMQWIAGELSSLGLDVRIGG